MNFFQRLLFRIFPPKVIPVIINGGDVKAAGPCYHPETCLMTTALKLRGYSATAPHCEDDPMLDDYVIFGKRYRVDLSVILEGNSETYDSSIVGTKFELTRI